MTNCVRMEHSEAKPGAKGETPFAWHAECSIVQRWLTGGALTLQVIPKGAELEVMSALTLTSKSSKKKGRSGFCFLVRQGWGFPLLPGILSRARRPFSRFGLVYSRASLLASRRKPG